MSSLRAIVTCHKYFGNHVISTEIHLFAPLLNMRRLCSVTHMGIYRYKRPRFGIQLRRYFKKLSDRLYSTSLEIWGIHIINVSELTCWGFTGWPNVMLPKGRWTSCTNVLGSLNSGNNDMKKWFLYISLDLFVNNRQTCTYYHGYTIAKPGIPAKSQLVCPLKGRWGKLRFAFLQTMDQR